ncbi:MAG: hypothetical protein K940chlam9_01506 [Chlamydiae bacterium]|nr:hypothetical protein [Chlamydiota bacterium]
MVSCFLGFTLMTTGIALFIAGLLPIAISVTFIVLGLLGFLASFVKSTFIPIAYNLQGVADENFLMEMALSPERKK